MSHTLSTTGSEGTTPLPDVYVDAAGNVKQLNAVNSNQFFPDLRMTFSRNSGAENASDGSNKKEKNTAFSEFPAPSRESGPKTVHFDENATQVAMTPYDEESDNEVRHSEAGSRMSRISTSDSISLPTTSPGPSRDYTEAELFSTQVDEETLEAAKVRQRRRVLIIEPDPTDNATPVLPTLDDVVSTRAKQHFEHGMSLMKTEDYLRAIGCFNKALNLWTKDPEYFKQRGEAYLFLCDYQSAILNYKRACVLDPDNFTYYSRLAFIYFFQGQCLFDQKLYPEALEAFSRAAEMRPEVVGYHTRSIACLAALERHGECLALVNKRLETESKNADLYVMRARLHELFRNTTLCYYDIKDALGLDPTHQEALILMQRLETKAEELKTSAMHLNLLSRHRDALQKISLAIETNPSIAEYHILRGALHRRLSDFNSAIDDYLLALDKTNHDEDSSVYQESQRQLLLTYNDFAVECFTKGFFEEAIILLNKAIKGEKREKGLYVNRGDCFFRQGHFNFALADYHQALEIDHSDDSIRNRIAIVHNEYGVQDYQDKNYVEAESRFTLAIQHSPKQAQYYISRARSRQMLENASSARMDVLMALHLNPQDSEIMGLLTRLFPGKSVKDVMGSRAAHQARQALEHLVVTAGPVRLTPISPSGDVHGSSESVQVGPIPGPVAMAKPGQGYPDLKTCMAEHDFHIKIVKTKTQISRKVKSMLNSRQTLNYKGGRVNAFMPDMAPSPPSAPKPNGQLAVNAVNGGKKGGWKKFTLGIGIAAVPDMG